MEEKDARIIDLEAAAARHKSRAEELQRSSMPPPRRDGALRVMAAKAPAAAPVGEAKYLAADLDRSLASISSMLQGLVERVKRLNQSLSDAEAPAAESIPAPPGDAGPGAAFLASRPLRTNPRET